MDFKILTGMDFLLFLLVGKEGLLGFNTYETVKTAKGS